MRTLSPILAAALAAAPAAAAPKQPPASAADSAERFNLDLAPAEDNGSAPARNEPASETPPTRYSLDTPIGELLANFRSKAVLDRDMPGLSTDKNLDKFKPLSLRKLAPLSGGRVSPDLLEKVGKDLGKIE